MVAIAIFAVMMYLGGTGGLDRKPEAPAAINWRPFSWPEAGVECVMPEKPVRENQHVRAAESDITFDASSFASSSGRTTYSLSYVNYPPALRLPETREELTSMATQWLTANSINDDATAMPIFCDGHHGFEVDRITCATNGRRLRSRARWFLIDRRGIVIGATGDEDRFDDVGCERFLQSLRFLPREENRGPP